MVEVPKLTKILIVILVIGAIMICFVGINHMPFFLVIGIYLTCVWVLLRFLFMFKLDKKDKKYLYFIAFNLVAFFGNFIIMLTIQTQFSMYWLVAKPYDLTLTVIFSVTTVLSIYLCGWAISRK